MRFALSAAIILLAWAVLALAGCTAPEREQAAADLLSGPEVRCREAVSLYDEAPGVWVGVLTAASCAG